MTKPTRYGTSIINAQNKLNAIPSEVCVSDAILYAVPVQAYKEFTATESVLYDIIRTPGHEGRGVGLAQFIQPIRQSPLRSIPAEEDGGLIFKENGKVFSEAYIIDGAEKLDLTDDWCPEQHIYDAQITKMARKIRNVKRDCDFRSAPFGAFAELLNPDFNRTTYGEESLSVHIYDNYFPDIEKEKRHTYILMIVFSTDAVIRYIISNLHLLTPTNNSRDEDTRLMLHPTTFRCHVSSPHLSDTLQPCYKRLIMLSNSNTYKLSDDIILRSADNDECVEKFIIAYKSVIKRDNSEYTELFADSQMISTLLSCVTYTFPTYFQLPGSPTGTAMDYALRRLSFISDIMINKGTTTTIKFKNYDSVSIKDIIASIGYGAVKSYGYNPDEYAQDSNLNDPTDVWPSSHHNNVRMCIQMDATRSKDDIEKESVTNIFNTVLTLLITGESTHNIDTFKEYLTKKNDGEPLSVKHDRIKYKGMTAFALHKYTLPEQLLSSLCYSREKFKRYFIFSSILVGGKNSCSLSKGGVQNGSLSNETGKCYQCYNQYYNNAKENCLCFLADRSQMSLYRQSSTITISQKGLENVRTAQTDMRSIIKERFDENKTQQYGNNALLILPVKETGRLSTFGDAQLTSGNVPQKFMRPIKKGNQNVNDQEKVVSLGLSVTNLLQDVLSSQREAATLSCRSVDDECSEHQSILANIHKPQFGAHGFLREAYDNERTMYRGYVNCTSEKLCNVLVAHTNITTLTPMTCIPQREHKKTDSSTYDWDRGIDDDDEPLAKHMRMTDKDIPEMEQFVVALLYSAAEDDQYLSDSSVYRQVYRKLLNAWDEDYNRKFGICLKNLLISETDDNEDSTYHMRLDELTSNSLLVNYVASVLERVGDYFNETTSTVLEHLDIDSLHSSDLDHVMIDSSDNRKLKRQAICYYGENYHPAVNKGVMGTFCCYLRHCANVLKQGTTHVTGGAISILQTLLNVTTDSESYVEKVRAPLSFPDINTDENPPTYNTSISQSHKSDIHIIYPIREKIETNISYTNQFEKRKQEPIDAGDEDNGPFSLLVDRKGNSGPSKRKVLGPHELYTRMTYRKITFARILSSPSYAQQYKDAHAEYVAQYLMFKCNSGNNISVLDEHTMLVQGVIKNVQEAILTLRSCVKKVLNTIPISENLYNTLMREVGKFAFPDACIDLIVRACQADERIAASMWYLCLLSELYTPSMGPISQMNQNVERDFCAMVATVCGLLQLPITPNGEEFKTIAPVQQYIDTGIGKSIVSTVADLNPASSSLLLCFGAWSSYPSRHGISSGVFHNLSVGSTFKAPKCFTLSGHLPCKQSKAVCQFLRHIPVPFPITMTDGYAETNDDANTWVSMDLTSVTFGIQPTQLHKLYKFYESCFSSNKPLAKEEILQTCMELHGSNNENTTNDVIDMYRESIVIPFIDYMKKKNFTIIDIMCN